MEEFTVSIGWKILFGVFTAGFAGLGIFILISGHPETGLVMSIIILSAPAVIVLLLIARIVRKVIIAAGSIVSMRLFGRKELLTANVKGFRVDDKKIRIESSPPGGGKIVIYAYDQLGDSEDLIKWLRGSFADLNAEDLKQERNAGNID